MPYELIVDKERQLLWARYSGMVTIDERRAVAEAAVGGEATHGMRRFLLDFRRATSYSADEASLEALAGYLARSVRGRHIRAAWLVTYDHQLDAAIEQKAQEVGVEIRRFRDFDAAVEWLQRPEERAEPEVAAADTRAAEAPHAPLGRIAVGASRTAQVARGTFTVEVAPQSPDNAPAQAASLARLSLDKRYEGPLDAIGQGEMLADGGAGRKHGAYVAMERVTGTLHGRAGSFALVHRALMRDGTPEGWSVVVVPGSGTGALAGIDGSLRITIEHGTHFYDLEYTLPA